jgi:hypothetical protein
MWNDGFGCLMLGPTTTGSGSASGYKLRCIGTSFFSGAILCSSITGNPGLAITGNTSVTGTLSCTSTKPFDIKHPTKPGYRLRHRCLEMPKAVNAYRFTLTCVLGRNEFDLPEYFEALNTEASVIASPADCFGQAFGSCSTNGSNKLTLFCSSAGTFNVLVLADRNDQAAIDEWNEHGVEFQDPAPQ